MFPPARFPHAPGAVAWGGGPGTVPVPPGQYGYSSALPPIMQALTPSYVVAAEPVFMDHLLMHVDSDIVIQTVRETLKGRLAGVAIDHLQLNVNGVPHHIRFEHIVYFSNG